MWSQELQQDLQFFQLLARAPHTPLEAAGCRWAPRRFPSKRDGSLAMLNRRCSWPTAGGGNTTLVKTQTMLARMDPNPLHTPPKLFWPKEWANVIGNSSLGPKRDLTASKAGQGEHRWKHPTGMG